MTPRPLAERIAGLPAWAREHIAGLERQARQAGDDRQAIRAQFADSQETTDTLVEGQSDTIPDRYLPNGSRVEFYGTWAVTSDLNGYGLPDALRMVPAILVEGYSPLEVVPLGPDQVLIRNRCISEGG
jgi:hypothetical protein